MIFRQYLDREPVIAASYLFGCPTKGVGAVVDPMGDIRRYLKESEQGSVTIRYVIDTHMHADHISSGRELAEAVDSIELALDPPDVRANPTPHRRDRVFQPIPFGGEHAHELSAPREQGIQCDRRLVGQRPARGRQTVVPPGRR